MNSRDITILHKMAKEAAESAGAFANVLNHLKANRYNYISGGVGAVAGGAGAALATKDKKNRIRNSILGAIGVGAIGYGGAAGISALNRKPEPVRPKILSPLPLPFQPNYDSKVRLPSPDNNGVRERVVRAIGGGIGSAVPGAGLVGPTIAHIVNKKLNGKKSK